MKHILFALTLLAGGALADDHEAFENAKAAHEKFIQSLNANPDSPMLLESQKKKASSSPNKISCWFAGVDWIIGVEGGVCRGGGKTYGVTILNLGIGAEAQATRITFKSKNPFPSHVLLMGGHGGLFVGIGGAGYSYGEKESVNGYSFGLGLGGDLSASWFFLDEIVPTK
jgi:hypothetical protein